MGTVYIASEKALKFRRKPEIEYTRRDLNATYPIASRTYERWEVNNEKRSECKECGHVIYTGCERREMS